MKFWLSILSLTALLSLSLLSVLFMAGHHSSYLSCIAGLINGFSCPESTVGFASYHLKALQQFSNAILLTLTLAFLILLYAKRFEVFKIPSSAPSRTLPEVSARKIQFKFLNWFSILENSPSLT